MTKIRLAFVAACAILAAAGAFAATMRFDLPAQPLAQALRALGQQANLNVIYDPPVVGDRMAPAIRGDITSREAIQRLLKDSGLEFEFMTDKTVAIRLRKEGAEARATARRETAATPVAVQLARADGPVEEGAPAAAETAAADEQEIVVTGSHIAGAQPVGSQVLVLDRSDIVASGRSTMRELLTTLPQNQGLGARDEATYGGVGVDNSSVGTAVNLRGLGTASTLVLLNGRRLAPTGLAGFVDVSQIPLFALERIEVVTDGTSAIYGSDAIAGVVNLITRKEYSGAESSLRYRHGNGFHEAIVGQSLGLDWASGSGLLSYEYLDRSRMRASERRYVTADLRPYDGQDFRLAASNPGTISAGGVSYGIPRGQNGQNLTAAQLLTGAPNLLDPNEGTDLVPRQKRHSLVASVTQSIGERSELFADVLYSRRTVENNVRPSTSTLTVPSANPFFVSPVPGATSVSVQYSFIDDLGATDIDSTVVNSQWTAGVRTELAGDWSTTFYASRSVDDQEIHQEMLNNFYLGQALASTNRATAFNPFGDGSFTSPDVVNSIRGHLRAYSQYEDLTAHLTASGSVFSLPAGQAKLGMGGEFRMEELSFRRTDFTTAQPTTFVGSGGKDRDITAVYAELMVPLAADRRAMRKLDLSLAGRWERYSDIGSSFNPKIGFSWMPAAGLILRSTWGTAFRAPILQQTREYAGNPVYFTTRVNNPAAAGGTSPILAVLGNNVGLGPEESENWSVGVDLAPAALPNLRVSATYYRVDYTDKINQPSFSQAFTNPVGSGARVISSPTQAQLDVFVNSPFYNSTFSTVPLSQVLYIVDARLQNAAKVFQDGVSLDAAYRMAAGAGSIDLLVSANYIGHYQIATRGELPLRSTLNNLQHPVSFQARAGAMWRGGDLEAGVSAGYVGDYENTSVSPAAKVDSWMTVDLHFSRSLPTAAGWLAGVRLSLDVSNALDNDPPALANTAGLYGYDPEKASAAGRVISGSFTKRW